MPFELTGEHTLVAIRTDLRHPFDPDASGIAIELDTHTLFFYENPDDGYRSSCGEPLIAEASMHSFGVSPEYLHIPVLVRSWTEPNTDGIEVLDRRNGKTILTVGTANIDDYYPYFVCEWVPRNIQQESV